MDSRCPITAGKDNEGVVEMTVNIVEDGVAEAVKANFPDAVSEAKTQRRGRVVITVQKDRVVDVALLLKERLGFDYVTSVSGVDYPNRNEFEVVYHIWSISRKILIALKTTVSKDDPRLQSLISVWDAVNYHERETHEMFGIDFIGHPNLTRFLLPEDWDKSPPFRKDFKLPTEPR